MLKLLVDCVVAAASDVAVVVAAAWLSPATCTYLRMCVFPPPTPTVVLLSKEKPKSETASNREGYMPKIATSEIAF